MTPHTSMKEMKILFPECCSLLFSSLMVLGIVWNLDQSLIYSSIKGIWTHWYIVVTIHQITCREAKCWFWSNHSPKPDTNLNKRKWYTRPLTYSYSSQKWPQKDNNKILTKICKWYVHNGCPWNDPVWFWPGPFNCVSDFVFEQNIDIFSTLSTLNQAYINISFVWSKLGKCSRWKN